MKLLENNFELGHSQSVQLVPGYYFFTETVEVPPEITGDEIADFLEYNLEDVSPFPIEQLLWGFLPVKNSSHVLLYAAYRPRLNAEELKSLEDAHYAIPSFLSLQGIITEEDAWYFIQNGDNLSAQYFQAGNPVPMFIENIKIEGDPENIVDVFTAKEELIYLLPHFNAVMDSGIVKCESSHCEDESVQFSHQHYAGTDSHPSELEDSFIKGSHDLWSADVRDSIYAEKEIKRRQFDMKLWKAVKGAGIAASILLALQIGQFVSGILIDNRDAEIADQIEPVARIQLKEESLKQLNNLFEGELQPFDMLEAMNKVRPNQIYYRKVSSDTDSGPNRYIIEGEAPRVSEANAFYDNLKSSPHLIDIQEPITKSLPNSKIKFTIKLKFKPIPESEESVALQP